MAIVGSDMSNLITPSMRLIHVGRTTIDADWNWSELRAPYWRLYTNLDPGAQICPHEARPVAIPAGALVVIPAWLGWSAACHGQVRHRLAHVHIAGFSQAAYRHVLNRPFHLGADLGQRFIAATDAWQVPDQRAETGWVIQGLVAEALAGIHRQLGGQAGSLATQPTAALAGALNVVEERLHQSLPLQALADYQGVSTATLGRLFRAHLGCSPGAYIRERRIAVAAEALSHGRDSLEHIAEQVGFADRHAFSKAFAAIMGCGPATYRRSTQPQPAH